MTQQAMTEPGIRVAIGQFNEMTDEKLRFAAQLGVKSVQMNTPKLPGETHWEEKDLRALVLKCQEYDLVLEAIENVPIHFYQDAMLGRERRDEQIAHYQTTIRNVGKAGIPILGYHWMPKLVLVDRTLRARPGRGPLAPSSTCPRSNRPAGPGMHPRPSSPNSEEPP